MSLDLSPMQIIQDDLILTYWTDYICKDLFFFSDKVTFPVSQHWRWPGGKGALTCETFLEAPCKGSEISLPCGFKKVIRSVTLRPAINVTLIMSTGSWGWRVFRLNMRMVCIRNAVFQLCFPFKLFVSMKLCCRILFNEVEFLPHTPSPCLCRACGLCAGSPGPNLGSLGSLYNTGYKSVWSSF